MYFGMKIPSNFFALLICISLYKGYDAACSTNNGGCENVCEDVGLSVRCSCDLLGTLQPDMKTCSYKPMLYFAHGKRINFVVNSTSIVYLYKFKYPQINAIAHDYSNKRIFYATVGNGSSLIGELLLSGYKKRKLVEIPYIVDGLAFNQSSRSLYAAVSHKYVFVINDVDVSNPTIHVLHVMKNPRAIVLESCYGFMFITDWGNSEIIRINMNTLDVRSVVNTSLEWPNALAIDKLNEKIFWADAGSTELYRDKIEMANYDGSCRKIIARLLYSHPFAMVFVFGQLFWTDWKLKIVYKTVVKNGVTSTFAQLTDIPYGIDYFGLIDEDTGDWSSWVDDTKSCITSNCNGSYNRTRVCKNPYFNHYNESCLMKTQCSRTLKCLGKQGFLREKEVETAVCDKCLCKVDGGWGEWQEEPCPKTCGNAITNRTRQCNNPLPKNCGVHCPGSNESMIACMEVKCPEHGGWGEWRSESCSKTCGVGIERSTRQCNDPVPTDGGDYCSGSNESIISCMERKCKVHGGWGEWESSLCSKTCGDGIKRMTRHCNNPTPADGGKSCNGSFETVVSCFEKKCPVHGGWGEWESSLCSKTCGDGIKRMTRHCNNPTPADGGKSCNGSFETVVSCFEKKCPGESSDNAMVTIIGGAAGGLVIIILIIIILIILIRHKRKNNVKHKEIATDANAQNIYEAIPIGRMNNNNSVNNELYGHDTIQQYAVYKHYDRAELPSPYINE